MQRDTLVQHTRHAWALFTRTCAAIMAAGMRNMPDSVKRVWADTRGEMDPSRVVNSILAVVIVAAIVAATIGLFFSSIADVNNELSTAQLNDTTANTIAGIYPIILGIAAVLGIVGLVLAAIKFRR